MTVKAKSDVTTKQSRFSLTIINESDIKIIEEFKNIIDLNKKK